MKLEALRRVSRNRLFKFATACMFSILLIFVFGIAKQYTTVFMSKKSTHESTSRWIDYRYEETEYQKTIPTANWRGLHSEFYKMAPEVFDEVPASFNSKYKSPCWRRNNTMHCLPYFYVAGMPKCGTSDVWDKLVTHPQIMRMRKEPHWWTRGRIGISIPNKPPGIVPLRNYTTRHQKYKFIRNQYQKTPEDDFTIVWGDGSASTLWETKDWAENETYPEPPYLVPDIISTIQPQAKIIVILRDPIARLYSSYLYFHKEQPKRRSFFHTLVEFTIASWRECRAKHSLRYCAYASDYMKQGTEKAAKFNALSGNDVTRESVRLHIGMYNVFLRDWLRLKKLKYIHVLRLEDWHENCNTLLPGIFEFLDLEKTTNRDISNACGTRIKNVANETKLEMYTSTRTLLDEFYRPFNEDLSRILKDSRFLWNE